MTKLKIVCFIAALLLLSNMAEAQKRTKKPVRKPQPVKVEPNPADVLYDEMLGSTAQVMFIDSNVVDKSAFLSAIPLSRESGFLSTYNDFWKSDGQSSAYTYMNEFGSKVIFSMSDATGNSRLYTSDKLAGQWSEPKRITDFDDDFEDVNCPYMMPDGITLYFAAKGKNTLGGYDLFVTMYDNDSARFYKPENIGLPYNSKGNDYYYVIDDFNSLGWLVTDRNQPEGKVCVYTFVPSESRRTYDEDAIEEQKLRDLASISSIKDSWTDMNELRWAQKRLSSLKKRGSDTGRETMSFHINDKLVYGSPTDFKVAANRQRYAKLTSLRADKAKLEAALETLRRQYMVASKAKRGDLAPTILKNERQLEQTGIAIAELEKTIRNAENSAIKQ